MENNLIIVLAVVKGLEILLEIPDAIKKKPVKVYRRWWMIDNVTILYLCLWIVIGV